MLMTARYSGRDAHLQEGTLVGGLESRAQEVVPGCQVGLVVGSLLEHKVIDDLAGLTAEGLQCSGLSRLVYGINIGLSHALAPH